MSGSLGQLQEWYRSQCDGEWEHTYGVHITTLDNPGWGIAVDLTGTTLEDKPFQTVRVRRNELDNWYVCCIEGSQFKAYCGPLNLDETIQEFLTWVHL